MMDRRSITETNEQVILSGLGLHAAFTKAGLPETWQVAYARWPARPPCPTGWPISAASTAPTGSCRARSCAMCCSSALD